MNTWLHSMFTAVFSALGYSMVVLSCLTAIILSTVDIRTEGKLNKIGIVVVVLLVLQCAFGIAQMAYNSSKEKEKDRRIQEWRHYSRKPISHMELRIVFEQFISAEEFDSFCKNTRLCLYDGSFPFTTFNGVLSYEHGRHVYSTRKTDGRTGEWYLAGGGIVGVIEKLDDQFLGFNGLNMHVHWDDSITSKIGQSVEDIGRISSFHVGIEPVVEEYKLTECELTIWIQDKSISIDIPLDRFKMQETFPFQTKEYVASVSGQDIACSIENWVIAGKPSGGVPLLEN